MRKIKQAREAMPNPFSTDDQTVSEFREQALKWMGEYYFEIQKSLNALERMQGVDFKLLQKALDYNETLYAHAKCDLRIETAARTLADIKKEIEV